MGHILNSDLILRLDIEGRGFSAGGAGRGGAGCGRHRWRHSRWLDNRPRLQLGCACLTALWHFTFDLCLPLLFAGSWTPAKDGPGCWHCRWDLFATAWVVNMKMRLNEAESNGNEAESQGNEVEWDWIKRKSGWMRLNQEEIRLNEAESRGNEVEWGWIKRKWGWMRLNHEEMRLNEAESRGNQVEWGWIKRKSGWMRLNQANLLLTLIKNFEFWSIFFFFKCWKDYTLYNYKRSYQT